MHGNIKITVPFVVSGAGMWLAGQYINITQWGHLANLIVKTGLCGMIYFILLFILMPVCDCLFKTNIKQEVILMITGMVKKRG